MSVFWKRNDILQQFQDVIKYGELQELREKSAAVINRDHWAEMRGVLEKIDQTAAAMNDKTSLDLSDSPVLIGRETEASPEDHETILNGLELLKPWRKGPFSVFGNFIDTEWQSNRKWERIAPELGDIKDKRVADIGCGNGYYMYRALAHNPELIVGVDPFELYYYQFEFLQHFVRDERLVFELTGADSISIFPEFFDLVLCMGVVYHHRDPIGMLKTIASSMRPEAELILESIVIPGEEEIALCPSGRYTMMRNVFFVPTATTLKTWAARSGFEDIEIFSTTEVTIEEQRSTRWAPFNSLEDFLDPNDSSKTVEGYDAPLRVALKARRKPDLGYKVGR